MSGSDFSLQTSRPPAARGWRPRGGVLLQRDRGAGTERGAPGEAAGGWRVSHCGQADGPAGSTNQPGGSQERPQHCGDRLPPRPRHLRPHGHGQAAPREPWVRGHQTHPARHQLRHSYHHLRGADTAVGQSGGQQPGPGRQHTSLGHHCNARHAHRHPHHHPQHRLYQSTGQTQPPVNLHNGRHVIYCLFVPADQGFQLTCLISVSRQIHPTVSQAVQHQSQVSPQTAQGGRQEVQEGVRDGAPGDVVHTMQMEESLHQVWRGGLDEHWHTSSETGKQKYTLYTH